MNPYGPARGSNAHHGCGDPLQAVLLRHWGLSVDRIEELRSGHTNRSYLVECTAPAGKWVLRLSWPGKPAEQTRHELRVLDGLHALAKSDGECRLPGLPTLCMTLDGQRHATLGEQRRAHLFHHIQGTSIEGPLDRRMLRQAMVCLGRLHGGMRRLPGVDPGLSGVEWLAARYARVGKRPRPLLPEGTDIAAYDAVMRRIGQCLIGAAEHDFGTAQWLHGDFHAGNLLWIEGRVSGVLDFDDTGLGAPAIEAGCALFALTRDDAVEDHLAYDEALWRRGADVLPYGRTLLEKRETLKHLFCVKETLVHLEAAQRGLWALGPGIGFLAGWHELLRATRV